MTTNINNQKIEGFVDSDGSELEVNEIYTSFQCEGPYSGVQATFIRLAGCNLCCVWCDTEYTTRKTMKIEDIVGQVKAGLVVITGGEPTRQNIAPLVKRLEEKGFTVQIETNGLIFPDLLYIGTDCNIVISPKTAKISPKYEAILENKDQTRVFIKLVVGEGVFPSQPGGKGGDPTDKYQPEFVLPCDTGDKMKTGENVGMAMVEAAKRNCVFQLQLHKVLGIK